MPTKGGKLATDDLIRDPDGNIHIVVERLGNDPSYSVQIRKVDGTAYVGGYAHGRKVKLLLNAGFQLEHNGWQLLTRNPV